MSCILHIETSTKVCSVAVTEDGVVLFEKTDKDGPSHAVQLGVFVDEALSYTDNHGIPFDAVAVSCGPGSYTGLRIGVSMAKGLCFGRQLPLIAIPTLETLCVIPLLYNDLEEDARLCPMIDARRMEVYTALYDRALHQLMPTTAMVIGEGAFGRELDEGIIYFMGNGADKCKQAITHANARFIDNIAPLAKSMAILAEKAYAAQDFKDVAYFEPFYLKDFVASTPKKLL